MPSAVQLKRYLTNLKSGAAVQFKLKNLSTFSKDNITGIHIVRTPGRRTQNDSS